MHYVLSTADVQGLRPWEVDSLEFRLQVSCFGSFFNPCGIRHIFKLKISIQ